MFLEKKILPHGSVASLYVTNVTTSPFESLFNGPGDINICDTDLQLPRCDGLTPGTFIYEQVSSDRTDP